MPRSVGGIRLCWIVLLLVVAGDAAAQGRLAITPVTVVDVTDGSLEANQTVLIERDRIVRVGPAPRVEIADGTEVVDGKGGYLTPGLWDMHGHAATSGRVEHFFRLFLANGITGFRDPFGSLDVAAEARASLAAGRLAGPPRMVVAGNLIDSSRSFVSDAQVASTPEEGAALVESLHRAGAPFIKVYFGLSPDTYFAIAQRARALRLPFVGHVPTLVRAADASDAGQRSIEHLTGVVEGCSSDEAAILSDWKKILGLRDMAAVTSRYFEPVRRALATQDERRCRALMKQFVRNETWQVPTLVSLRGKAYLRELAAGGDPRERYFAPPSRWTGGRPFGFAMTDEQWRVLQSRYQREKEIVGEMAATGVPILAGSDVATPWVFPGFGLHAELALLVEAGLTPLQALQAATLNPARFFGRTNELGTVAAGKLADLLLLERNPLEDISNTRSIRAVIADGRLYRRADLDRLLAAAAVADQRETQGVRAGRYRGP